MKECPSCKAWCFDDMETCFGCLHRFGREEDEQASPSAQMADALSKSSLLGSAKSKRSDTRMKVAVSEDGGVGTKVASFEDGGVRAKDATFDMKGKVAPFAGLERVVTPSGTVRPFTESERVVTPSGTVRSFTELERVVTPSGVTRPFAGDGAESFSLREGWTLRIEVPESGDGLVVRLERPLP